MKTLILALLLLPFVAFSQIKTDTIPFIGAKKIIVKTDSTAKAGFKMIGNLLLDNGFDIDKKDNDLLIIKTQPRAEKVKGQIIHYYLNIRSMENYVAISGKWINSDILTLGSFSTSVQDYDIEQKKKSMFFIDIFPLIEGFAKKLNKPLIYSN